MKFHIITFGCKVNSYESNFIKESLENNGFSFSDDLNKSDIVIVNTCTVTDTSDKKCQKMIRHIKRENPSCILVVCGCSVQYNDKPYEDMDVDIMLGNNEKSHVYELIQNFINTHDKYKYITKNRNLSFENMSINSFNHVRAFIKVQDGCDNFCSYCIIPFVRGSIRSKNFDSIIKEASSLASNGYKEIVLTGIHTGSYNDNGKDLTDLLHELSKIDGIKRLRLSSIEITELNDKFLNELKNNSKICNHLHIPLQSGTDEILKLMNRKYDLKYYEEKINKIRRIRPDISITTDVIVGFNYETDELFNKTVEFCKKINFAKIHVFPYSERTGTKASFMDGKLDNGVKKDRSRKLIELSNKLENYYYNSFIGKEADILIEAVKNGKSVGHTSNYLKVELNEELKINEIYQRTIQ